MIGNNDPEHRRRGRQSEDGSSEQQGKGGKHVPFCILVRRADHLWEVDDDGLARVASDEDVELVEVAMDEPSAGEADDEVHQFGIERARRR